MEAASTAAAAGGRPEAPSLRAARRRYGEDLIKGLLVLAALISLLTTVGIVFALLEETIVFFGEVGVDDFLFGTKWTPLFGPASFGVLPLVAGTFATTLIALLVAIPLGLGAAIYLSEYARPRVRKTIKPILELLAGVPTIVFGYFALTFFTPEILRGFFSMDVAIFNALAAGIIIGFLIIPIVASISEDAMRSVPQSLREGAFGLGASKLQVSLRVVFPAALSGHRGLDRARHVARGRRDDGRAHRRRPAAAVGRRRRQVDGDAHGLHRRHRQGRRRHRARSPTRRSSPSA